jgi:hypothetical protein
MVSSQISRQSIDNDSFNIWINEQRRQNRLLEHIVAAINTSNALLAQLVQRS